MFIVTLFYYTKFIVNSDSKGEYKNGDWTEVTGWVGVKLPFYFSSRCKRIEKSFFFLLIKKQLLCEKEIIIISQHKGLHFFLSISNKFIELALANFNKKMASTIVSNDWKIHCWFFLRNIFGWLLQEVWYCLNDILAFENKQKNSKNLLYE